MKEPHEKGLAIRSAPSFARRTARCAAKRKQGNRWGGYSAPKRCNPDADALVMAEGNMNGALARVLVRSGVVEDPRHA